MTYFKKCDMYLCFFCARLPVSWILGCKNPEPEKYNWHIEWVIKKVKVGLTFFTSSSWMSHKMSRVNMFNSTKLHSAKRCDQHIVTARFFVTFVINGNVTSEKVEVLVSEALTQLPEFLNSIFNHKNLLALGLKLRVNIV